MRFLLNGNEKADYLYLFTNPNTGESAMKIKIREPNNFPGLAFTLYIDLIINPEQLPYLEGFKEALNKFKKDLNNEAQGDNVNLEYIRNGYREIKRLLSKFDDAGKLYLKVI